MGLTIGAFLTEGLSTVCIAYAVEKLAIPIRGMNNRFVYIVFNKLGFLDIIYKVSETKI
jgi:hypothetical protein